MNLKLDVLCIGNATMDVFLMLNDKTNFSLDKFTNQTAFTLGQKIPVDEYIFALGGNASNVSVGLSRLGFKTGLSAEIGSDEFSEKIINNLKKENVDQSLLKKNTRTTPYFNFLISYQGERIIFEEKKPSGEELIVKECNPRLIYLTSINAGWDKIYSKAFELNPNAIFALNPGTKQITEELNTLLPFLQKTEILFVNLEEAKKIAGEEETDIKIVLKKIKTWGVKCVVITDGRNGSFAIDQNGDIFQAGVIDSAEPVERTGAGDSYASGFIYAFLNGHSVKEAMRFGALNANFVIKQVGAQKGLLKKEEMEEKIKEFSTFSSLKI